MLYVTGMQLSSSGTVPELAAVLRLSERTLRAYASSGEIVRVGWTAGKRGTVPTYDGADVLRVHAARARRRDAGWLAAMANTPGCLPAGLMPRSS